MEEKKIKYGVIHCHTDNSLKDSALTVKELVKKAVELGCPALTITDHGNMMGIYEFMDECAANNIKGVPGVECYYKEDINEGSREHILLLAKNYDGLIAIGKIVTESNMRLDSKKMPLINSEILKKYIGKGTKGYNNVIVTSACVSGILASVLLSSDQKKLQIERLTEQMKGLKSPEDKSYKKNSEILKQLEEQINQNNEKKKQLKANSKKTTKKKEKSAEIAQRKGDLELYKKLTKEIESDKNDIAKALDEIPKVTMLISSLSAKKKDLVERMKKDEAEHAKMAVILNEIEKIKASIKSEASLYKEATEKALFFENLVGKGNFYIELQNHFMESEEYTFPILARIAKNNNIPVVAANDIHIYDNSEESLKARQLMRSLRYNKWENRGNADSELYMKTDEELSFALSKILPKEIVEEAMYNVGVIFDQCDVKLEKANHYPKFISDRKETADEALVRLTNEGIKLKFPNEKDFNETYKKRLKYEIDVITRMGYSDYHLITQDFLNFGRKLGKVSDENLEYIWNHIDNWNLKEYVDFVDNNMTEVGYSIGPGRGSAAGSLVCYLLGITSIDPIKFNLLFERFLNVERVSMPDIDSDLSPRVRDLVIEYVKKKYGKDAVCCIMTRGTQKAKAAIRNVARVMGTRDNKTYLDLSDAMAKNVPVEVGMNFDKCKDDLEKLYSKDKIALEIIENAALIENRLQSVGMHAAGVIISDGHPVSDYIPLMWDEKNKRWKTQCDKDQDEKRGMLKMDFLGLNNLNIITDALRLIQMHHGIRIDIEKVPFEDVVFSDIYSKAFTNMIFQFESGGMKDMLKRFRPSSIEDIILLVAAYRPGPMQYLDKIINVKHGKEKIAYSIPELEPILNTTYGSIIYQEQVQQIFRNLAGYSLGQADMVRRAMSKKKEKVLIAERQAFVYGDKERNIVGCKSNGIGEKEANQIFDEMIEFAKYAFNKSHAAAYAIVSYQTAWLKYHYPKEYLCAAMSDSDIKKIPVIIGDCKALNINVLPPNINESNTSFTIKDNAIIFGLSSIKDVGGVGESIMKEVKTNGKFVSFKDYMKRGHRNKKVTEALIDAGCFDAFGRNRKALKSTIEELNAYYKKVTEKSEAVKLLDEEIKKKQLEQNGDDEKALKSLIRRYNNAVLTKENAELNFNKLIVPAMNEDKMERLKLEKERIGVYVSGHPLDEYEIDKSYTPISDLEANKRVKIVGVVSDLRKTVTKAKKEPMAFFNLEDKTDSVKVTCFPKAYKEFGQYIYDDAVIVIEGKCKEEEVFNSEDETEKVIDIIAIHEVKRKKRELILYVNDIEEWINNYEKIQNYKDPDGYNLLVFDKSLSEMRETDMSVSMDIMYNKAGLKVIENIDEMKK